MPTMTLVQRDGMDVNIATTIEETEDGFEIWSQALKADWFQPWFAYVLKHSNGAMIDIDSVGYCWLPRKEDA